MCKMRYKDLYTKVMFALGLCNLGLNTVAQETYDKQAVYKMTFQTDSNDIATRNSMKMELLINDGKSLFQALEQRQQDSVIFFHNPDLSNRTSYGGGIIAKPINKFSYKIIKEDRMIKVYDSAFGLNLNGKDILYVYEEPLDSLPWQIKEDTLHFANWICQRAELEYGGRRWTAWFAPDVPVFDGPYKFAGLPGLIIKITDEKEFWDFELLSLKQVSIKHAINFQKWFVFEEKSKKELYQDRRDFQKSLPALGANAKPENPADEEKAKNALKRLKVLLEKDNNWIELYP